MKCGAQRRDGQRCKANALHGKNVCSLHADANRASALARSKRKRSTKSLLTNFPRPKTAIDLQVILAATLVEVRNGEIEPRVGNAVAGIATAFLAAFKIGGLEERVQALEQQARARFRGQSNG